MVVVMVLNVLVKRSSSVLKMFGQRIGMMIMCQYCQGVVFNMFVVFDYLCFRLFSVGVMISIMSGIWKYMQVSVRLRKLSRLKLVVQRLKLKILCRMMVMRLRWLSVDRNVKVSGMLVKFEVMLQKVSIVECSYDGSLFREIVVVSVKLMIVLLMVDVVEILMDMMQVVRIFGWNRLMMLCSVRLLFGFRNVLLIRYMVGVIRNMIVKMVKGVMFS